MMKTVPDFDTVIVGAGFSGIGTAIKLDKSGLTDYLIIEAGDGPGGTWYWNTYPGIAVDIPSFSYQFSFEQSPNWSRTYAPGHELKAYAEHCVDKYGLRRKIRFNTKVLGADFDDDTDLWRVDRPRRRVVTARFLVNASGVLIMPKLPDIDGVDAFAGLTMHTARWDHDAGPDRQARRDHRHRRLGGAGDPRDRADRRAAHRLSAHADLVLPQARRAAARRGALGDAHPRRQGDPRLLSQAYVELTFTLAAQYFTVNSAGQDRVEGRRGVSAQARSHDPEVRDKLTPRYAVGCKRPGFHNTYLSTFNRDNVELVTEPIDKITGSGVATDRRRRTTRSTC